jgi:acyl-CoA synthetase (AMP-forming)/AMP-acid ligase II
VDSAADLIPRAIAEHPDTVALIAGGRAVTYRELGDRVGRVAGALAGLGISRGDRVALLLGTTPEFVE